RRYTASRGLSSSAPSRLAGSASSIPPAVTVVDRDSRRMDRAQSRSGLALCTLASMSCGTDLLTPLVRNRRGTLCLSPARSGGRGSSHGERRQGGGKSQKLCLTSVGHPAGNVSAPG